MNILESVIPIGKDNAIHQEELAQRLGVTPAAAKKMVRKARQQGLQVLSGTCGYWIAANEQEREAFVNLLRKQAFSRLNSAKAVNDIGNDIKGQIGLFDADIEGVEKGAEDEQKEE